VYCRVKARSVQLCDDLQRRLEDRLLLADGLMRGSNRELLPLGFVADLGRSRTSTVGVNSLLSLVGIILRQALNRVCSVGSVLAGKVLDLLSLSIDQVVALLKLSINDLLVLDIDEGSEVGDSGGNQGQAPERDKLDEEVRNQRRKECL
jgi:hypothetical protein